MKNIKYVNIKNIIRIILIVVILVLAIIFSLSYIINKNNDYQEDITKNIKEHYNVDSDITYSNAYGNYYIFTTKNNVIVLNKEYEEVLKEDINTLADNKEGYELIYKTKTLMYEKTTIQDNKVIYTYYDAKTYKELSKTELEK